MVDCQEEQAKYSSHKNEKIKSHTLFCKLLAVKHAKMSSIGAAERKFRVKKEKRIKRMDTKWIRGKRMREWILNESKIKKINLHVLFFYKKPVYKKPRTKYPQITPNLRNFQSYKKSGILI